MAYVEKRSGPNAVQRLVDRLAYEYYHEDSLLFQDLSVVVHAHEVAAKRLSHGLFAVFTVAAAWAAASYLVPIAAWIAAWGIR